MSTQSQNLQSLLQLPGDIVASAVPELRTRLRELLDGGVRQLVLDLSNVKMVDSVGIGLLIATHNTLRKTAGELSVIHASNDVFDLFRTLRLHQHFSISKD